MGERELHYIEKAIIRIEQLNDTSLNYIDDDVRNLQGLVLLMFSRIEEAIDILILMNSVFESGISRRSYQKILPNLSPILDSVPINQKLKILSTQEELETNLKRKLNGRIIPSRNKFAHTRGNDLSKEYGYETDEGQANTLALLIDFLDVNDKLNEMIDKKIGKNDES